MHVTFSLVNMYEIDGKWKLHKHRVLVLSCFPVLVQIYWLNDDKEISKIQQVVAASIDGVTERVFQYIIGLSIGAS